MPSWRVDILCEDRRSERFLVRLCERFGIKVLYVYIAPAGKGTASDWILKQYASLVRRRRSKNHQRFLGLLVHVDGDNLGLAVRKEQFATQLREEQLDPRSDSESVALLVPTWSIETWLASLNGADGVTETQSLKALPPYAELWRDGDSEAATILTAAQRWPGSEPLPSLVDSKSEGVRVGLG